MLRQLQHIFLQELPGESAHALMIPLDRQLTSQAIKQAINVRESAVGIYLAEIENELHVILIKRPEYDGAHSGQIAFPGGKVEVSDPTLEYTARRESFEEVGIAFHQGILLGNLSQVYIPVSNFRVNPFVYYLDQLPDFVLNQREVEQLIYLPIHELLNEDLVSTMTVQLNEKEARTNIPCFIYQNYKIWGATALMLSELKTLFLHFTSSDKL